MKTREDLINELESKIAKLEGDKIGWRQDIVASYEVAITNCYIALAHLYNGKL